MARRKSSTRSEGFSLSPFKFTRGILEQLLSVIAFKGISVTALSWAAKPFALFSKSTSKQIATRLYGAILDALNIVFWVSAAIIVADVTVANGQIFKTLDQNRWVGFLFFALVAFRYMVRKS